MLQEQIMSATRGFQEFLQLQKGSDIMCAQNGRLVLHKINNFHSKTVSIHQNPLIFHENEPTLESWLSETTERISIIYGALKSPWFGVSSRLHAETPVFLSCDQDHETSIVLWGKSRPGGVSHPTLQIVRWKNDGTTEMHRHSSTQRNREFWLW